MDNNFWFALWLTILAWFSTGIWSFLIFFSKKFNPKFLSASLGFSAGVMLYVSFIEILPKWIIELEGIYWNNEAEIYWTLAFFLGIIIIAIIDILVPNHETSHKIKHAKEAKKIKNTSNKKLLRMWVFSAIAITLHNFPEWLATFMAALKDTNLGISIAVAIAIHNIPEGIAVAIPIYYATKSKWKASVLWLLSGFSEVFWALIWYFLIIAIFWEINFGYVFGIVAGIMVYISLDELLPTAQEYWENHIAISWVIVGMAVMAISLFLF